MNNPILMLDIDGVLNDHTKHDNGYGGIKTKLIKNLNIILDQFPDLKIVISSSWRYVSPDPKVHEFILLIHGANVYGKVLGVTDSDESIAGKKDMMNEACKSCKEGKYSKPDSMYLTLFCDKCGNQTFKMVDNMPDWEDRESWIREGLIWREKQIKKWLNDHSNPPYVVLDDLPIKVDNLVQTDPDKGITKEEAKKAILVLNSQMNKI